RSAGRIPEAMSMRGLAGKRDYVRSLETRRDEEALSLLVECLCDESWYLRELAEAALLRMSAERVGPVLLPLLDQGLWFSRSSTARVLGRLGYGPAAPGIVALTVDPVATVRDEAYSSLVTLDGQAAQRPCEARIAATDRALADRLARMAERPETDVESPEGLRDDAPWVRACEEGTAWDEIPSPPPVRPAAPAEPAPRP
ncbi:MAG: HEAT repeat domain-containing protein, partial [bacterium]